MQNAMTMIAYEVECSCGVTALMPKMVGFQPILAPLGGDVGAVSRSDPSYSTVPPANEQERVHIRNKA